MGIPQGDEIGTKYEPNISIHDIRDYREKHECSLIEAGQAVRKKILLVDIIQAKSLEDLRAILVYIVKEHI